MDKRVTDVISNKYITKKIEIELELEKLINNSYNISIEESVERIINNVSKLRSTVNDIQMWETIVQQLLPQNPEKE
ncbi:MAG: hypothetical protein ACK5OW_00600 [bacterium]|jgi:hypothetical protein